MNKNFVKVFFTQWCRVRGGVARKKNLEKNGLEKKIFKKRT